jgi:hypothetical protein
MIPEAAKTAFRTGIAGAGAPTGLVLETEMKEHVYRAVAGFYTNVYASATTPITQATLDSLPGPRDNPHYRLSQAAAKAYFVDQTAVSTPPASSGASTPPPAGTGPSPNPQTGNQASSGSYNQLRAQFDVKKREYDALIASLSVSTNPSAEDITRLRNLNREAFALLEQTIRALSSSQVANMTAVNTELSAALARIDRQYNILVENSDRLEALKRIREYEQVKADGSINVYMTLLLIVALALLVIMMFSQPMNPTIASAPASPAITPN